MPTPEEGLREAERRIENALHEGKRLLDLSELGLTALPESIGQLIQFRALNLSNNQLTELPEAVSHLTSLEILALNFNQLTALPESIGQLAQLQHLYLGGNPLTTLPESIGRLDQLWALYLDWTRLTALPESFGRLTQLEQLSLDNLALTVLPASVASLTHLKYLSLDGNRLTALPESIGRLSQLEVLSLGRNKLTKLPESIGQLAHLKRLYVEDNRLTTLPESLERLAQLQELYLHGNPRLQLPPEILGPTFDEVSRSVDESQRADPKVILAYYRESRETKSRPMSEAKLLLVGQGRVGKTSLVRYLVNDEPCNRGERPTEGIRRVQWGVNVKPPKGKTKQSVTLNVWDFGGQEIMHATHQFFLTKRSLYLLVLDAGTNEAENNLFYWLKVIQSFGGDAPILVVINKIDGGLSLDLNETRLKKDFPNIRDFYPVSCLSGKGIPELRKAIEAHVAQLPHVFDPVPAGFFKVRQQLGEWAGKKSYITFDTYRKLCDESGVKDEDQIRLLRFLHDLGIALNFDDPDDPYELHDTNVLDPEWVTDAVYRVITSRELKEARGVLHRSDLAGLLKNKTRFPPAQHEFILELMRKFELCFDFPDSSGERFLVPERLDKDEPDVGWTAEDSPDSLNFQVKYNVLPPGLLCRFIVKMHAHLKPDTPTYWRDGAVLYIHGNRCLVRGSVEDRRIFIQIQGQEATRREALGLIRERLGDIHRTIRGLEVTELVPVPGQGKVTVEYNTLLENIREGIDRFIPPGGKAASARELLKRVETGDIPVEAPGLGNALRHLQFVSVARQPGGGKSLLFGNQLGISFGEPKLPTPVDFGIITMKEEEYQAVENRFEPVEIAQGQNRRYLLSRVPTPAGEKTVLIARCLEQGQVPAQQCANDLINDAGPRWLFLVGIAGAFPAEEFTLGDVLLASRIHDFAVTAALEGKPDELAGKGGPVHRDVAALLELLPSAAGRKRLGEWNGPAAIPMPKPTQKVPASVDTPAFYGEPKWRKRVQKGLRANFPAGKEPRLPLYRTEAVVTANVLAKDTELVQRWKEVARTASHVEMELGGVYEAAHRADKPVLSVRGLSDVVGFVRSSAWTQFACQTAAAFARALIGSGLIG